MTLVNDNTTVSQLGSQSILRGKRTSDYSEDPDRQGTEKRVKASQNCSSNPSGSGPLGEFSDGKFETIAQSIHSGGTRA